MSSNRGLVFMASVLLSAFVKGNAQSLSESECLNTAIQCSAACIATSTRITCSVKATTFVGIRECRRLRIDRRCVDEVAARCRPGSLSIVIARGLLKNLEDECSKTICAADVSICFQNMNLDIDPNTRKLKSVYLQSVCGNRSEIVIGCSDELDGAREAYDCIPFQGGEEAKHRVFVNQFKTECFVRTDNDCSPTLASACFLDNMINFINVVISSPTAEMCQRTLTNVEQCIYPHIKNCGYSESLPFELLQQVTMTPLRTLCEVGDFSQCAPRAVDVCLRNLTGNTNFCTFNQMMQSCLPSACIMNLRPLFSASYVVCPNMAGTCSVESALNCISDLQQSYIPPPEIIQVNPLPVDTAMSLAREQLCLKTERLEDCVLESINPCWDNIRQATLSLWRLLVDSLQLKCSTCDFQIPTITAVSSRVTTAVTDATEVKPAESLYATLFRQDPADDKWKALAVGKTGMDGRWVVPITNDQFILGLYKIVYNTRCYFKLTNKKAFYPYVEFVFEVTNTTQSVHLPLFVSLQGYSIYRDT